MTAASCARSIRWRRSSSTDSGPISRGQTCGAFSRRASYAYQLDAFAAAVLRGEPVKTTPEDAVENMEVIDAIYRTAGLPLREPVGP